MVLLTSCLETALTQACQPESPQVLRGKGSAFRFSEFLHRELHRTIYGLGGAKKAPRRFRGAFVNPKLSERPYFPFFSSFLAPFFPFFFMSNLLQGLCRSQALAPAHTLASYTSAPRQSQGFFALDVIFLAAASRLPRDAGVIPFVRKKVQHRGAHTKPRTLHSNSHARR